MKLAAARIYRETLARLDSARLIQDEVQYVSGLLYLRNDVMDLSHYDRVWVCGAGKASPAMVEALVNILGPKVAGGICVTKDGYARDVPPIEMIEAGHPVPDARSLVAGARMMELGEEMTEKDLVLFCLSGGSSALMESLRPPLTLPDLRAVNEALLRSPVGIQRINAVRRRLSELKAGGLALAFRKASVHCLVVSDVFGNDLSVIGSGPFVASQDDETAFVSSFTAEMPPHIRSVLKQPWLHAVPPVPHMILASPERLRETAAEMARFNGFQPRIYGDFLQEDATVVGEKLAKIADHRAQTETTRWCAIFIGEPTVAVQPGGIGGRCQQVAASAALHLAEMPGVAVLAGSSDGTDGPTDVAAAAVDCDSAPVAAAAGFGFDQALASTNTLPALDAAGALIRTGPTGTNLADLFLILGDPQPTH